MNRTSMLAATLWLAMCLGLTPTQAAQSAVAPAAAAAEYRAVLDKYCVTCHNDRLQTASLSLEGLDLRRLDEHKDVFEKVVRKVSAGAMPPVGMPRPTQGALDGMVGWLVSSLDRS